MTELLNLCLLHSRVPACLKEGLVTLVPKVKQDGSYSKKADEMRPITVLPEMGKVLSRILATRLGRVFTVHPGVLSDAQRAFISDGSVDQCAAALVDVLEDWSEFRRGRSAKRAHHIHLISYDQRKAYDSVQAFTIRASLERFGLPEAFTSLVMDSLVDARSSVRTFHGPTRRFTLKSGVRQGDPLAPLIYTIITDALHEGLKRNPLPCRRSRRGRGRLHLRPARAGWRPCPGLLLRLRRRHGARGQQRTRLPPAARVGARVLRRTRVRPEL
jgi:hypothetical protein